MSRPRLLADHDLNEHLVTGVLRREPTIEFLRVRDLGLDRSPDEDVLQFAASHGLVVVSHDVNTMIAAARRYIADAQPMAGLLMVRQADPLNQNIESLLLIWSCSEAEEWRNQIAFLPF